MLRISSNGQRHWYKPFLICPDCRGDLEQRSERITCEACEFSTSSGEFLDLRPQQPKDRLLELPTSFYAEAAFSRVVKERPPLTYRKPVNGRDSRELLSVIDQTLNAPSRVLDLGCGPKDQLEPITSMGHHYVGLDLLNAAADIQGDAHTLPFANATFDAVFSFAVLEHVQNPMIVFSEVNRVLKPNGVFVGTVAQGEPFHSSFFHHTTWGVLSLANAAGLSVDRLWTCTDTLYSLASMGRYPRVLRAGIQVLHRIHSRIPLLAPRKFRWSPEEKLVDSLHRAGSLGFVIRKVIQAKTEQPRI